MKYFFGKLIGFINGVIACFMFCGTLLGIGYVVKISKDKKSEIEEDERFIKEVQKDLSNIFS